MSNRFVRKSSFRHVHGSAAKPAKQFLQTQVMCSGDGNFIAGNDKYFCYAGRGGGGPVYVINRDDPKRLGSGLPKLCVHKGKVLDFDWNPFDDSMLATASEDCHVKVSVIPEGGLKQNQSTAICDLIGHEKKIVGLRWHPTATGILATAGFDRTVKVWDVSTQQVALDYATQHGDALQHIGWNRNGSLMATTCKDKHFRIFDPRDQKVVHEVQAFAGSKKSTVVFLDKTDMIATIGFTRSSMRQIQLYDNRNMSKSCYEIDIDQSAGVLIPHYDYDTSILYLGGKGDGSIKYWECVKTSPYLHFLSSFSDNQSQKGLCFLPKTSCDTTKCEIASCLRVMRDAVVPVSFQVPRKASDLFQSDLYPDAVAGIAAQDGKAYLDGGNAEPVLTSMKPGQRKGKAAAKMVVKKSYAELEAALAAAEKRIKELEAQLA